MNKIAVVEEEDVPRTVRRSRKRSYDNATNYSFSEISNKEDKHKVIRARCIVESPRDIKGQVLFSSTPIAFLQGVDPERGVVSDKKHELYGKPFAGRILVFPNTVGSSVGAYVIYRLKKNGLAPKAIINQSSDIITASGCALSGIPLFDLANHNASSTPSSSSGASIKELSNDPEITIDRKKALIIIDSS